MHIKIHERRDVGGGIKRVIAACDSKLLGRRLESRGAVLDLKLYRSFYEGKKVDEKELAKLLHGAENVNLVGEQVIEVAARVLPIDPGKARKIGGVPHLQFYLV